MGLYTKVLYAQNYETGKVREEFFEYIYICEPFTKRFYSQQRTRNNFYKVCVKCK